MTRKALAVLFLGLAIAISGAVGFIQWRNSHPQNAFTVSNAEAERNIPRAVNQTLPTPPSSGETTFHLVSTSYGTTHVIRAKPTGLLNTFKAPQEVSQTTSRDETDKSAVQKTLMLTFQNQSKTDAQSLTYAVGGNIVFTDDAGGMGKASQTSYFGAAADQIQVSSLYFPRRSPQLTVTFHDMSGKKIGSARFANPEKNIPAQWTPDTFPKTVADGAVTLTLPQPDFVSQTFTTGNKVVYGKPIAAEDLATANLPPSAVLYHHLKPQFKENGKPSKAWKIQQIKTEDVWGHERTDQWIVQGAEILHPVRLPTSETIRLTVTARNAANVQKNFVFLLPSSYKTPTP